MAAVGQHELDLAAEQVRRAVARLPRGNVVVGAGEAVDVTFDLFQVDRGAAHFQGVRAGQRVALEHFDQVAVEGGRQARGVVVPEQDVEHRRFVAEQVVVDPVVPDQVIGAHPGEHLGHVAAFQHTGLVRLALGRFERLFVDEQRDLVVHGRVEYADQQGQGIDLVLAKRCIVADQRGAGDAARAGAEYVQILAAGDRQDRIDRFLERIDVGRQAPFALGLGRVAPADDECLLVRAQAEARQAFLRAQVEHIELVDLRRHHQQRAGMHLFGDGPVLDQLQHVVAVHHRAFAGTQVLAHLEGVHVDLAGHAAVVDQVLGQVGQAVEQALATGLEEALDRCRVGQGVGGGHCLGHQVDDELATADVLRGQVAVADPVLKLLAPGQVRLQIATIQWVLAPGRIIETTVVAIWRQAGLAQQHVLQLQAEVRHVLGAVQRLTHGLAQHVTCRAQQVLAADADDRIQPQGVFRGLPLQLIVVLVTHLRRSVFLRRVPDTCARGTADSPVLLLG
ncbi:hypothetical protein D3C81_955390 [compost metagenome]